MPIFDSQQPKPRRCQFFAVFLLAITSSILSYPLRSCDLVRIAINDSPTTQIVAHIDEAILRGAFNCDVVLTPSEIVSAPVFMVMAQETPDVVPLVWSDDLQLTDDSSARYRNTKKLGSVFQFGLRQGFWVPTYMSRALPKLATLEGVLSHPELFPHPTKEKRAAFFGCPLELYCGITSRQMYKAFAMADSGFEYVEPDSIDQLFNSLQNAYEQGNGWFGYLWEPTAEVGTYDLTRVDEGIDLDKEEGTIEEVEKQLAVKWLSQIQTPASAGPEKNRYPLLQANTYVTDELKLNPLILDYLARRTFPNHVFSHLLSWKKIQNVSARATAQYFLQEYEKLWSNWVDFDSAVRIKYSLMIERNRPSPSLP
jgi:glycine betaine/proline transport system substrate-binding protein